MSNSLIGDFDRKLTMANKPKPKSVKKSGGQSSKINNNDDIIVDQSAAVAAMKVTADLLDLCSRSTPANQNALWAEHSEIRRLLNEFEQSKGTTAPSSENFSSDQEERAKFLQPFLVWCDKMGVQRAGTEIMQISDKGFGLVSNKEATFGEILVKVPYKAMLTMGSARRFDFKPLLERDPLLKQMPNVALSMHLINEKLKGEQSHFVDYINFLPRKFSTPLYFDPDDLLLLKGSFYFDESLKLWRNISRQFAYFHQILSSSEESLFAKTAINAENFDFDLYRWATVTVMTRVNLVPDLTNENRPSSLPALIPYLDMANHDPRLQPCTDFDESQRCAILYSGTTISCAGEEICMFYGRRTNGEFLLHNGFIANSHGEDGEVVNFRMGLTKTDLLLNAKKSALQTLRLDDLPYYTLSANNLSRDLRKCLLFAVVFCSTDEISLNRLAENAEFCATVESEIGEFFKQLQIDEKIREKSIDFLKTRFNLLLKMYSFDCNIEQNIVDRKSDIVDPVPDIDRDDHGMLARVLIRQEKEILNRALRLLETV